jgi:hypothetical protein
VAAHPNGVAALFGKMQRAERGSKMSLHRHLRAGLVGISLLAGTIACGMPDFSSEPPADFSGATMMLEDLPDGFESLPPSDIGLTEAVGTSEGIDPINLFYFQYLGGDEFQVVYGFTGWIASTPSQAATSAQLEDGEAYRESLVSSLEFDTVGTPEAMDISVGDVSQSMRVLVSNEDGEFYVEAVGFMQGAAFSQIFSLYPSDIAPTITLADAAQALAARVAAVLAAEATE